jgi:serum/glucocorticoid-regulated kinase 2
VVYRDLKPENILMNLDGYLCLADFGLSRIIGMDEVSHTFVGTAEYLSPEMIKESGHHTGVDWWALGILLYEMIVGIPPFYHANRKLMYRMILEKNPKFPDMEKHGIYVSASLQDLIMKLLDKDMDK